MLYPDPSCHNRLAVGSLSMRLTPKLVILYQATNFLVSRTSLVTRLLYCRVILRKYSITIITIIIIIVIVISLSLSYRLSLSLSFIVIVIIIIIVIVIIIIIALFRLC